MAEPSATVWRATTAGTTGADYVDALARVILTTGTRWRRVSSAAGKVLLECVATGAQLVAHGTATQIQVGYAATGGVTSWDASPTAPVWTGMRNITGGTSTMSTVTATLDIAEYEDAILFAVGRVDGWRYAVLAGRALEPMDLSDAANSIGTDALFVGIPSRTSASPNWLAGSTTALTGSCARVGSGFEPMIMLPGFAFSPGTATPDRILARIGTNERFLPYMMHLLVTAGLAQPVGATKYIRQWRSNLTHGVRLFSQTSGSNQAWFGYQFDATTQNQLALWAKTETTV